MKIVNIIAKVLVIIGGLNWGLVAIAGLMGPETNLNVVNLLLGGWPVVENIVYLLVGISAIIAIFACKKCTCGTEASASVPQA